MIEVNNLVKRYAGVEAVRGISFSVSPGEIVGFLGPNGAGKSSTMKILSCFMPATSGTAKVAGFDTFTHSIEVRQRIGYMPENVPLYTELTVDEFLRFRAQLKGVTGKKIKTRVAEVKALCELDSVSKKLISTLSKGFRQRVALADAMVHDPDLLILDEPTIGLDPNQIRHVRDLIKSLGGKHTILLSTHILPEVEMTCSRVLILNKGRIEASDTPANLMRRVRSGGAVVSEFRAAADAAEKAILALGTVEECRTTAHDGWVRVEIFPKKGEDVREAIFHICARERWDLRELTQHKVTLEDVFVEITQEDKE